MKKTFNWLKFWQEAAVSEYYWREWLLFEDDLLIQVNIRSQNEFLINIQNQQWDNLNSGDFER